MCIISEIPNREPEIMVCSWAFSAYQHDIHKAFHTYVFNKFTKIQSSPTVFWFLFFSKVDTLKYVIASSQFRQMTLKVFITKNTFHFFFRLPLAEESKH